MLVKYFDADEGKIKTRLLDLLNVYEGQSANVGSSGELLFHMIVHTLNSQ